MMLGINLRRVDANPDEIELTHSMFHDISSEKWCASVVFPYYIEGTEKMLYVCGPKD